METTITSVLDNRSSSVKKDGTRPIKLYLYHKEEPRYIGISGLSALHEHWNPELGCVTKQHPATGRTNALISSSLRRAEMVITVLKDYGALELMSVQDVKVEIDIFLKSNEETYQYRHQAPTVTAQFRKGLVVLQEYRDHLIKLFEMAGNDDYAANLRNECNVFFRFLDTPGIKERLPRGSQSYIHEIKPEILTLYRGYLKKCGYKGYTPYNYFKRLAVPFKQAVDNGLLDNAQNPFLNFKRPSKPKGKNNRGRAARTNRNRHLIFDRIRELKLKPGSQIWHHRNYALFSWNCRGMNFIDIVLLTKDQVSWQYNEFYYTRHKLQNNDDPEELVISLTPEAKAILKYYYDSSDSKCGRVFPIMPDEFADETDPKALKTHYAYRLGKMNDSLKVISDMIELEKHITFYDIRRIYGERMRELNIDSAVRQDAYGHADLTTTRDYSGQTTIEELHNVNMQAVTGSAVFDPLVKGEKNVIETIEPERSTKEVLTLNSIPRSEPTNSNVSLLPLQDRVNLKDTGTEVTIEDFILEIVPELVETDKMNRSGIIIELVKRTTIGDAKLAAFYADAFLAA